MELVQRDCPLGSSDVDTELVGLVLDHVLRILDRVLGLVDGLPNGGAQIREALEGALMRHRIAAALLARVERRGAIAVKGAAGERREALVQRRCDAGRVY